MELRTGEATTGGQSTCYIPVNSREEAEGINHTRRSMAMDACMFWFCLNELLRHANLPGPGIGLQGPFHNTGLSPADGPPYIYLHLPESWVQSKLPAIISLAHPCRPVCLKVVAPSKRYLASRAGLQGSLCVR